MKRYILALVLMLSQSSSVFGQSMTDKLGIGGNVGAAKVFGDYLKTGFGPALEAYLKYQLNPRFFFTTSLGYADLSMSKDINPNLKFNRQNNTFSFDVKGGINLITQKVFQPYAFVGLGAVNFHTPWLSHSSIGYFAPSFMFGGGLEYQLSPKIGFNTYADYRFCMTDDLDNISIGANDGYLNIRGGITYYLSPRTHAAPPKVLAEKLPLDEVEDTSTDDDEFNALVEGIEQFEETSSAGFTMDKYIELKSRVDQLNDAIRQKGLEIDELKTQLQLRKERATKLEQRMHSRTTTIASSPASSVSYSAPASSSDMNFDDYSSSYEQGLEHFYAHEYDAAIHVLGNLLQSYPNHRLASNSRYWIGECYFGKRDYEAAIESFNLVVDYENSVKKDDALLMLGRCYSRLGNSQMAKTMFDQLMSQYPDSEYYYTAEKYANELEIM